MRTFNFNKPYEELSFNEILSILLEIADSVEIVKINRDNKFSYNIDTFRIINDYQNENEFNLQYLSFTWNISFEGKDLDNLESQNSNTYTQLDSYFESAINLDLIEIK